MVYSFSSLLTSEIYFVVHLAVRNLSLTYALLMAYTCRYIHACMYNQCQYNGESEFARSEQTDMFTLYYYIHAGQTVLMCMILISPYKGPILIAWAVLVLYK